MKLEDRIIQEFPDIKPSGGHDHLDELMGLLRVTRQQRDDAERRLQEVLSSRGGRAKRDLQGSLQRGVGRSASGGKPGVVTRAVGRKKAVQKPVAFTANIRGIDRTKLAYFLRNVLAADVERGAVSAASMGDSPINYRWKIIEASDAASCKRQRAIPANAPHKPCGD